MFKWFKKSKVNKELQQNLTELKQMILDITITENGSAKELETFYAKVDIWNKVLAEKQFEFFVAMKELSSKDKSELLKHIDKCANNYGAKMIKLNELLIKCLEEEKLSQNTKTEIALFGKNNVNKSNETLATLQFLAKCITLSK